MTVQNMLALDSREVAGLFSLPETSIQANRTVRIAHCFDVGSSMATASERFYAYHVQGFQPHVDNAETEMRAFSFDLGTNQRDLVDGVRGIKGRVYGDGGNANLRSIYGFAEGVDGSGFSGMLTGLLGTVYKNDTPAVESVAVRGHVDDGCTAAFEAAGAKVGETTEASFGFRIRAGTGNPLLPTVACFAAHGGGTGDMFIGYASHTDLSPIYRVDRLGKVTARSFRSGRHTIADDAALSINPPSVTGVMTVITESTDQAWATVFYRASGTHLCRAAGVNGSFVTLANGPSVPTGQTGPDGSLNIIVCAGQVHIENRLGAAKSIIISFTGG